MPTIRPNSDLRNKYDESLSYQGIRKLLIGNYVIFYIVREENRMVTILRILYGKREWLNIL